MEYRIGIIGYGNMADYHVTSIPKPAAFRFTAAYDIDKARLLKAKERGISPCGSAEELLKRDDVDLVLVATPNVFHFEYAQSVLLAGKALFLEKPATLYASELERLIALAREKNLLFTVHQNRRNDLDFLVMKQLVASGELGEVFRMETRVQGSRGIADTWRRNKQMGGGLLYDWGAHLLDELLQLTDKKVTSVSAEFQDLRHYGVDDNVRVTLGFEGGLSALAEIGTCNYANLPVWYVAGRQGTAVIQDWNQPGFYVKLVNADIKWEDEIPPSKMGPSITFAPRALDTVETLPLPVVTVHPGMFYENLLLALEGKTSLLVKPEECLRSVKIIEAAFVSDRTRQTVHCEI